MRPTAGAFGPCHRPKIATAGRRPANSCRGEMGEGAGQESGTLKPIKVQVGSIKYLHATSGVKIPQAQVPPVFSLLFTGAARTRSAKQLLIVGGGGARSARTGAANPFLVEPRKNIVHVAAWTAAGKRLPEWAAAALRI